MHSSTVGLILSGFVNLGFGNCQASCNLPNIFCVMRTTILLLLVALPAMAQTNAASLTAKRVALVRVVNEEWTVKRSEVEQKVEFQQANPIKFGERNAQMNVACSLTEGRAQPAFVLLHFYRSGPEGRWDNYHRVVVNLGGAVQDITPDDYESRYTQGVILEQMTAVLTLSEFRKWAAQEQIGLSVAGEEFTLTQHTIRKWRTLLAYFDVTAQIQNVPKDAVTITNRIIAEPEKSTNAAGRLPAVAKERHN
jgi:hypothetical protein